MYGSTIFYSPPSPATDFRDNRTSEYPRPKPPYTHTISPYETSKFRYRTLSLKMGSVPFTINSETLTRMFSKFGMIESIQFKRQWPSLDATIRFQIVENAIAAKSAMEHRYLYEVGGMMEINYAADEFEYSGRGILSPKSSPSIETYGQSSQLLRVSIGFAWYPITAELVSGVFSYYGNVQILQMRQVGDAVEATLHYQSLQSAIVAQHALQGRNIHYTGGKMDIQFALESQPTMEQNFERIEEALKKLENICNSLASIPDRVGCDESNASATSADYITDNPTQVQGISIVEPIVDNVSFIPCIKVLNSDIFNLNCETENIVCDIASFTSFNELEKTDFVEIQGDKVNVHEVFDELTMRIDEDHFVANDDEHLTDPKCYNDDTPHLNSEVRISDGFVNFDGQLVQKASPKMLKFEDVEGQLSFDSQLSYDYRHMFLLPRSMDNISISQFLLTEVAKSSNHYTYSSSSHALENVLRSKTMEWDPGIKKWEKMKNEIRLGCSKGNEKGVAQPKHAIHISNGEIDKMLNMVQSGTRSITDALFHDDGTIASSVKGTPDLHSSTRNTSIPLLIQACYHGKNGAQKIILSESSTKQCLTLEDPWQGRDSDQNSCCSIEDLPQLSSIRFCYGKYNSCWEFHSLL